MLERNRHILKNIFFLAKTIFALLCIYLFYAVGCMGGIRVFTFPIDGCISEMGGPFSQLSATERVILTILFYVILLAIFMTNYFYHKKFFLNTNFYIVYKKFWTYGVIAFSLIWIKLTGLAPDDFNAYLILYYVVYLPIISAIIWHLTVGPANSQYESKVEKTSQPDGG